MNYNIIFDNNTGIYVVKTSGRMTGESFVDMAQGLLGHSLWSPGRDVIFDHTGLDFAEVLFIDLEMIRGFHKDNESQIGGGKSAIVVKPGFMQEWHNLWSQGEKIQTENKSRVFENFENAIQWMRKAAVSSD